MRLMVSSVTNDKLYERIKGNPKHAFAFKMVLSDQVVEAKVVDVLWTAKQRWIFKPTCTYRTSYNWWCKD